MKRKLLCWVLVFSIAFQPLIFEGIAWAEESAPAAGAGPADDTADDQAKKAAEAQKQFEETYQKLMATEEIKSPYGGGIGGWIKKGLTALSGKKGEIDKAVKEANEEIKKAKEEMTKLKAELATGVESSKDAALQNAQAAMQKNLELSAKIQSAISASMKKVGELLTKLSTTLNKVASTLQKVATGVALIPVVGHAVSGVLFVVAKVLGKVSGVVGAVGKSMITFSEKADLSAKDFMQMITDAKDGWKKGGEGFGRPAPTPPGGTPGTPVTPGTPGGTATVPGGAPSGTIAAPPSPDVTHPPTAGTHPPAQPGHTGPSGHSGAGAANSNLPHQTPTQQRGAPNPPVHATFMGGDNLHSMGKQLKTFKEENPGGGVLSTPVTYDALGRPRTDGLPRTEFRYGQEGEFTEKVLVDTTSTLGFGGGAVEIWVKKNSGFNTGLMDSNYKGVTLEPLPQSQ